MSEDHVRQLGGRNPVLNRQGDSINQLLRVHAEEGVAALGKAIIKGTRMTFAELLEKHKAQAYIP